MKSYYYLVTGLPGVSPEDAKLTYSVADFRRDCMEQLDKADRRRVNLFFLQYDNGNLLRLLTDIDTPEWDERGTLERDLIVATIEAVRAEEKLPVGLPAYMVAYIRERLSEEAPAPGLPEDRLTTLYYEHLCGCSNPFLQKWFTFNLHLNNILIALTARRFGFDAAPYLVGDNEVVRALRTSGTRDFGLSSELDYFEELARISDITDPVEKERRLDLLKWNWLEEEIFFHPFTFERVFAYLIRLSIVERWSTIDKERGHEVFVGLIDKLKGEVEVPAEFKS